MRIQEAYYFVKVLRILIPIDSNRYNTRLYISDEVYNNLPSTYFIKFFFKYIFSYIMN